MFSATLPPHPSLSQYKKQAKDLLKSANSGDAQSIQRLDATLPKPKQSTSKLAGDQFTLADAQLAIAREHGLESWPKFIKHVEALAGANAATEVWKSAENSVIAADLATLKRLLREHERMFREEQPPAFSTGGLRPNYSGGDAQTILVSNHEFENWDQLQAYMQARTDKSSEVSQFEDAADAIVQGDIPALKALLNRNPDLIRARSTRKHHSTLLHYVGANGIEYYRQRSPRNIVEIAKRLIEAGAEVDAEAGMYGGGATTLGLVATSVHPERAGVQKPLMELLLSHGAKAGDAGAVNGCLGNGRKAAAEWYAKHGAPLDLEGAAGVGRLDLVKSYFAPDHSLANGASQEQMNRGFAWACEYGRTNVVEYLLDMGMDPGASLRNHGQTGLHWAAHCAHIGTARLLLKRGAEVDAKDATWGTTPLSWALHGWGDPPPNTPAGRYYSMVKLLVTAGAIVEPGMLESEAVRSDPRMLAALDTNLVSA